MAIRNCSFIGLIKKVDLLILLSTRYNKVMVKKKITNNLYKCCIVILSLIIVSGCSSKSKKEKILAIQKRRIHSLSTQLQEKEALIEKLKNQKWVKVDVKKSPPLKQLHGLVKSKRWIAALKESSRLKKIYPQSIPLRKYRYQIFSSMGLEKQALNEKKVWARLKNAATPRGVKTQ